MSKTARIFLILGVLILITAATLYFIYDRPLPEGKAGSEADALALKITRAVGGKNLKYTRYLEWSFRDKHYYKWDRFAGTINFESASLAVVLDLNDPLKSKVKRDGVRITGKEKTEIIEETRSNFNNDSFWLLAPFKLFDKGVNRKLVELEAGEKALLVTYNTGGTTPGDSYLWLINENGMPKACRMWVKIIPVGGLEASWQDWHLTETGLHLPTKHKLGIFTLDMGQVKAYN